MAIRLLLAGTAQSKGSLAQRANDVALLTTSLSRLTLHFFNPIAVHLRSDRLLLGKSRLTRLNGLAHPS